MSKDSPRRGSPFPKVLRPHERRSQRQATLETSEDEPFGNITPPSLEVLEALEKAFPIEVPTTSLAGQDGLADLGAQVLIQQGQQSVIQFLKNLSPNQGA